MTVQWTKYVDRYITKSGYVPPTGED